MQRSTPSGHHVCGRGCFCETDYWYVDLGHITWMVSEGVTMLWAYSAFMRGVLQAVRERMVLILIFLGFLLVGSLVNMIVDM